MLKIKGLLKIKEIAAIALGSLIGLTGAPAVRAADTPSPADGLLRQSVRALQSKTSIQADFEEIDSYPGTHKDLAQRGSVTLSRPDRLHIHIQRFRRVRSTDPWASSGNDTEAVSDGHVYSYAFLHPHSTQVSQAPVTGNTWPSALKGLPLLASFYAGAAEGSALPGQSGPASLLPAETWEGQLYRVVTYPVASERPSMVISARAYLGGDLLIHRLIYHTETAQGTVTKEWTLHKIVLNAPMPSSAFAYVVPPDATPLDSSPRLPLLANGSDAPDFTAYDKSGKPVKLSDYKGKTVVLDFWATWCWPCNQSLPQTEAVVRSRRDLGVVALAVAIRDSKTGFDQWLGRHSYPDIQFARDPAPQGKDAATRLYHVSTTPTVYVIDGNGKIVRSIEGFAGPSPELEAAIEAALSSKIARVR